MVHAVPAHDQARYLRRATVRGSYAEADVRKAPAGRKGERALVEMTAAAFPGMKWEGCSADLTRVETGAGRRSNRDARLGGMHEEHDSRRLECEVAKHNL